MRTYKFILGLLVGAVVIACNNETSLQEYYVENQENKDFVAIDVPTSLLANNESLDASQRETLESVRKINLLAYPVKTTDSAGFNSEKEELKRILENEKYQLLMRYGSGERKVEIFFTGEEDAVDEFVVYGTDEARGVGVARILGDDMNPDEILKFIRSLEEGDIDMDGLQSIAGMFGEIKSKEEEK